MELASNFEPIILTPVQAFAIINQRRLMLCMLVLVTVATAPYLSLIAPTIQFPPGFVVFRMRRPYSLSQSRRGTVFPLWRSGQLVMQ
jgi:hypothetical protein